MICATGFKRTFTKEFGKVSVLAIVISFSVLTIRLSKPSAFTISSVYKNMMVISEIVGSLTAPESLGSSVIFGGLF